MLVSDWLLHKKYYLPPQVLTFNYMTGIGKETVKVSGRLRLYLHKKLSYNVQALLAHSAKVYIGARSQERVEAAINDLKETGKEALFLKLDLSDLKSVETAATEFLRRLYNASMVQISYRYPSNS